MNVKEHKRKFSHMWLALFVMLLVTNVVQVIMSVAVILMKPAFALEADFLLLETFVGFHLVGLAVYFLMMRRRCPSVQREKKRMTVKDFIIVFFICMAATYLFNYASVGINYLIGLLKHSSVVNPLEQALGGNIVWQVFVVAISAPVVEEIIFRKLMLDCLRPYGDKVAIWVTALAFAMFHGNLSQALYAFALGVIFAYIVIRTNDVRYSIVYHILINVCGSVIFPTMASSEEKIVVMIAVALVLIFIAGGVIFFIRNVRNLVLEEGDIVLDKKIRFRAMYLNVGMVLYTISCMLMFLMVLLQ